MIRLRMMEGYCPIVGEYTRMRCDEGCTAFLGLVERDRYAHVACIGRIPGDGLAEIVEITYGGRMLHLSQIDASRRAEDGCWIHDVPLVSRRVG